MNASKGKPVESKSGSDYESSGNENDDDEDEELNLASQPLNKTITI